MEIGITNQNVPDSKHIPTNTDVEVEEKGGLTGEKNEPSKTEEMLATNAAPSKEEFVIERNDPDFIDFEAELQWLEQCSVNDNATVEAIDKVIDSTELHGSKGNGHSSLPLDESGIENHPEFETLMSGLETLERSLNVEYSKRFPDKEVV